MSFYLFPGIMFQRFQEVYQSNLTYLENDSILTSRKNDLESGYEIYSLTTKQYLGFGFLLQFVPGTNANKTRQQLLKILDPAIDWLVANFARTSHPKKNTYRVSLSSYLNHSALIELGEDFIDGVNHSGTIGLFSEMIKLPIKFIIVELTLVLKIVKSLAIDPLIHFATSIREAYLNQGNDILLGTIGDFQKVKELRRAAKGREDISYSIITKEDHYSQEYFGITKKELYKELKNKNKTVDILQNEDDLLTEEEHKLLAAATAPSPAQTFNSEKLVAIRASHEKIDKTIALLSVLSIFNYNEALDKDRPEAIEMAKQIVSSK